MFSTLCLPQAALAQSDRPPFPKDESARLGAEIRKDPENDRLRRELIDLLRPFGRTLKQPSENIYKLITSAAELQDSKRPGDLEKAIGLLKRAANSAAWYVHVYAALALAYDEAQNWAQAKRYYELFLYAGKDGARAMRAFRAVSMPSIAGIWGCTPGRLPIRRASSSGRWPQLRFLTEFVETKAGRSARLAPSTAIGAVALKFCAMSR